MINIDALIKNAMKSKDKVELQAYRNLKSEIQKYETSKGAKPLTSEKQLEIFSKYCSKLEDSIKQFSEARRGDLVFEYASELAVIRELLPEPVNESYIADFIENEGEFFDKYYVTHVVYSDDGLTEYTTMAIEIPKKDMGNAIKFIKSKFPTTDGSIISAVVKEYVK